ncbi:MAG: hypothetical protein IJU44_11940 [Kiritimatiellae bacterium]|nr:hypothetical protein [Kiritimatiellia bacterium]
MGKLLFFGAVGLNALSIAAANLTAGYGLVDAVIGGSTELVGAFPFRCDTSVVSGGAVGGASTAAINRSGENCWAPELVYQQEYYGTGSAVFRNLTPNASYVVELHFTENYFNGSGIRVFGVSINDTMVLSSFDIFATAGGQYIAVCKQFVTTADSTGKVTVKIVKEVENGHFSGISIWGTEAPSSPGGFSASKNLSTVNVSWTESPNVLRYYVQKAVSANGPWSDIGEYYPGVTSAAIDYAYDAAMPQHYRVVASNGVGTAVSDVVSYAGPSDSDFTDVPTRGATINSDSSAKLRIQTVGNAGDPLNALGGDAVAVNMLMQNAAAPSTLALGSGQTFTTGAIGIYSGAADLTIGDTVGQGAISGVNDSMTLRVEDADSTLTLNANLSAGGDGGLSVGILGLGLVDFRTGLVNVGFLGIGEGSGTFPVNSDVDFTTVLTGSGKLIKTGTGTATVKAASPDFAGEIVAREGTLKLGMVSPFNNAQTRVVVKSGATLDVGDDTAAANAAKLGHATVVVSGSGVEGNGALVNNSPTSQYWAMNCGELAGDAVFGGESRLDFRADGAYNTFKMNGHSITKVGPNMFCLTGIALDEGDAPVSINVNEGTWSSETTTTYSGGPQHSMNVASGALFDMYSMTVPFSWTLNLADAATVNIRNGAAGQNVISGPVNLIGNEATISGANTIVSGKISGTGKLKSSANRIVLSSGDNTYSGGTLITGGELYATTKGDLPGYQSVNTLAVTGGSLILPCGNGEWVQDDALSILNQGSLQANGSHLILDVKADSLEFAGSFDLDVGSFGFIAPGSSVDVTGRFNLPDGRFYIYDGTINLLSGNTYNFQKTYFRLGTFNIGNGTKILMGYASGHDFTVGDVANSTAFINVDNATLVTTEQLEASVASGWLCVASAANSRAIMKVSGDSLISNKVTVAGGNYSQGAIYQNGGNLVNSGGAGNDIRLGLNGYGYHELNGGRLEYMGYSQVGGTGASSVGYLVQHGGEFEQNTEHTGRLALCRGAGGGKGIIYQDGGVFRVLTNVQMGEWDNTRGGTTFWTIDGPDAYTYVRDDFNIANRTNHTAILNLNQGVFEAKTITARPSCSGDNSETAVAYVNFGGGTYRAKTDTTDLFKTGVNAPNAVTIYNGGATFDVPSGVNCTAAVPLLKPEGNGIMMLTIPDGMGDYLGPPDITISGGGGVGASAVALFDSSTRKITGVKITSPGTGYTGVPTITMANGGWTNVYTGTAAIGVNGTSGGITKIGDGTLALTAANTFGGEVRTKAGTLSLAAAGAFPGGNDIAVEGGVLQGNNLSVTAGVVNVTSGSINNLNLICGGFVKDGDDVASLNNTVMAVKPKPVSGLYAGLVSGAFNETDPNPAVAITASPAMGNSNDGWTDNTTWIYTGYIWNRSEEDVTWTFAEWFDDSVRVDIDGETVLRDTVWSSMVLKNVTLSPGAHTFEVRFGQGSGGAGPSTSTGDPDGVEWKAAGLGFAIDFQGRGEKTLANFTKLEDYENLDTLFTTVGVEESGTVEIKSGILNVLNSGAGLYEGVLSGSFNVTDVNPQQGVVLSTFKANTTSGWTDNTTAIYNGYIWNREDSDVTWTFAECFDDNVLLKIDGETVLNNSTWNDVSMKNVTLSPGAHAFEARFGQGGGGAGPAGAFGNHGFAIDFQGRGINNAEYFTVPSDPGDGSLFTTSLDPKDSAFVLDDTRVSIAKGASVNFFGVTTASFKNLDATGEIGNGSISLSGTMHVDAQNLLDGDHLTVSNGKLIIGAGLKISVSNNALFGKSGRFVIASTAQGVEGSLDKVTLEGLPEGEPWQLVINGNDLLLVYPSGTMMFLW